MFIQAKGEIDEGILLLRNTYGKKIKYLLKCAKNPSFSDERKKLALQVATFMKMKLQHTMFVQKEGMNILYMLKKSAEENPEALALNDKSLDTFTNTEAYNLAQKYLPTYRLALLWHDLGRTQEFDDNFLPTRVDHAVCSREMLEKINADALYQSKYAPAHKNAAFTIMTAMLKEPTSSFLPLEAFMFAAIDKAKLKANPTMKVSKTFSTFISLKI